MIRNLALLIFIFIAYGQKTFSREELVVIQSISTSKKSFVIHQGKSDGIYRGQEALFSTKDISFVGIVKESTRHNSLWVMADKEAIVPFKREEIVSLNHDTENIYLELNQFRNKFKFQPKEKFASLSVRANLSYTLYQSITETQAERNYTRGGIQAEINFGLFAGPNYEIAIGLRYDQEKETQTNPKLDIPTNRYFFTAEMFYHFNEIRRSHKHYYMSAGAGVGQSQTIINKINASGNSFLLPFVRLGKQERISRQYSIIYELSFESITSQEKFSDNDSQFTNIVNSKLSIGIKF